MRGPDENSMFITFHFYDEYFIPKITLYYAIICAYLTYLN